MPFGRRKVELTPSQKLEVAQKEFSETIGGSAGYVLDSLQTKAVKKLLDQGVHPDYPVHWGTALHSAASQGYGRLTKLLLDGGANINAQDNAGNTAVHYAFQRNSPKLVRLLIERGADLEIRNKKGILPHEETRDGKTLAEYYRATNAKLKRLVE